MTAVVFTPGPWHQGVKVPTTVWSGRTIASEPVALCHDNTLPRPQAIANACLIAAAPDLLEALEAMLDDKATTYAVRCNRARAAIAKARNAS